MRVKRYEDYLEAVERKYPQLHKACWPRQITVPEGYTDPHYYAMSMVGHELVTRDPFKTALPYQVGHGLAMLSAYTRMPVYFIADEFASAVANTELPGDFKFSELKWPLDIQIFVLSDKFSTDYYGCYAPFLTVGKVDAGTYPQALPRKLPQIDFPWKDIVFPKTSILMEYPFYGSEMPTTYNCMYPMTDGVEIFKEAKLHDATILERILWGKHAEMKGSLDPQDEKPFTDKAQMLAVKLLLLIAERPTLVEPGKVTRHAVVTQQGITKLPQIVSANFIGRTYHIPRQRVEATPGTDRARPKFLYRRGHWAWVAKKFKNQEFVSVDAMPRKAEGYMDFDAAGDILANKFRACHERQWIEGVLFE